MSGASTKSSDALIERAQKALERAADTLQKSDERLAASDRLLRVRHNKTSTCKRNGLR